MRKQCVAISKKAASVEESSFFLLVFSMYGKI